MNEATIKKSTMDLTQMMLSLKAKANPSEENLNKAKELLKELPSEDVPFFSHLIMKMLNDTGKNVLKETSDKDKVEVNYDLHLASKFGISKRILDVVTSLAVQDEHGEVTLIKHRNGAPKINYRYYRMITVSEAHKLKCEDLAADKNHYILVIPNRHRLQSKILNEEHVKDLIKVISVPRTRIPSMFGEELTIPQVDELCKVFDSIYDKEIIEYFPEPFKDYGFGMMFNKPYHLPLGLSHAVRTEYIKRAGYAIVTKELIDELAKFIDSRKCLEIMAGKGVISKGLRDKGIDIIATDNNSWKGQAEDRWTDVEIIDAGNAISKYRDVDIIIASWMPMDCESKRLVRNIRKYNPDVLLIIVGEYEGGCTSNDDWFDRVEEIDCEEFIPVENASVAWEGIHDKFLLYKVTKPWLHEVE